MTKKEAIKELQETHYMMRAYNLDSSESILMTALNTAIEALEQQPCDVLGKIREEIEQYQSDAFYPNDVTINKRTILGIIDKYKADKKDCTTCIGFGDKDYAQSFCHDCIKDIQNHYKADKGVEE